MAQLRPRTQQVVSIVDELLKQSQPGSGVLTPQAMAARQAPQPQVQIPMRADASNIGVPANAPIGQMNVPQVTPRVGDSDMGGRGMLRPGADVSGMEAAAVDADAKLRDLGSKATQAALLEAKNPELKKDPTFQERLKGFFGDRSNMLRMALAFNSLRLNPDQGLTAMLSNELKDLRTENRATNVAARLRQLGTPAAIRAAEYIEGTGDIKGGMTMYNKAGSVVQKTGAELGGADAGYDPAKTYNVDTITGKVSGIGGGDTSITVEGDKSKLFDTYYKYVADNANTYIDEGKQAQTQLMAFGRMNRALDFTDTGKEEQNRQSIRTMLDGLGLSGLIDETAYANAASFNAAANALVAEELRANKGPQTDFDARFAQTYIPGLGNPKEANREILKYGQSTAQIKRLLGQMANRVDPMSPTVIQDMGKINEYAMTIPNVVIKTDGTVQHFYDFYRQNRTVDPNTLFQAWMTFADRQREAGLQ